MGDIRKARMAASKTLEQGYPLSFNSSGLIVDADDTSGEVFAGTCVDQKVVSDASGKYSDSAYGDTNDYAEVQYQRGGEADLQVYATASTAAYVGHPVYAKDGSAKQVAPADIVTNDVEVGTVLFFKTSRTGTRTDDASVTSSTWARIALKTAE